MFFYLTVRSLKMGSVVSSVADIATDMLKAVTGIAQGVVPTAAQCLETINSVQALAGKFRQTREVLTGTYIAFDTLPSTPDGVKQASADLQAAAADNAGDLLTLIKPQPPSGINLIQQGALVATADNEGAIPDWKTIDPLLYNLFDSDIPPVAQKDIVTLIHQLVSVAPASHFSNNRRFKLGKMMYWITITGDLTTNFGEAGATYVFGFAIGDAVLA